LQTLLNFHGAKLECDASFGPATAKALAEFQKSRGITADSVAGVVTWQELMKIAKNT